ncbi:MAG: SgcJ/EcaC family oxidoreductase [Alphaproteobacteria bacterium]|nr:SgcJ/EcaC family oxidoreductase [Alphaproteobacteria bacterium]
MARAEDDRLAIRELHEAYADAVFRADADAWGALWAHDGAWTLMGQTVHGRDAIVALWTQAMSAFEVAAFYVQPGVITIDGDYASGRCWTQEVLKAKGGGVRRIAGGYDDAFVRRDGIWLFARRAYRVLIDEPGSGS